MGTLLFYRILEMSLQASFIIVAILLIRICLKNKPKLFSYILWLPVFLRLLCPATIELPISFVPENVSSGQAMRNMTNFYVEDYQIHLSNSKEFDKALEYGFNPIIEKNEVGEIESAYVITAKDAITKPNTIYDTWLPKLCSLWMIGMGVFAIYSVISYLKMKKMLVGTVPYDEEYDIYCSDYLQTAFVSGVIYPKIYLPSSLVGREREYILEHEKHHIKRKDYLIKMLAYLALGIHWFNPFVWIAFALFTKDMEMSCDEAVIRKFGENMKEEYSISLLNLATGRKYVITSPIAFGEGDTKERIKNAMKWKKPTLKTMIITSICCILVIIISLTNAEKQSLKHPYEWTNTVTLEDIENCSVVSWEDAGLQYLVTKPWLKDLVYVLNELSKSEITQKITDNRKEITVLVTCDEKEYMLTYGNGITTISFEHGSNLWMKEKIWQTDNKSLARCMRNMISQGVQIEDEETGNSTIILPPIREEVLLMRETALKGMSEREIEKLTALVQKENQNREYTYLEGGAYAEYNDPESTYWKLYTQSGTIQLGWGISSDAPEFDPEGKMTEEEYYEMYGTPYVCEVEVPLAEKFYDLIEEIKTLTKNAENNLLNTELDRLNECMRLAVEKRDVDYFHQIYRILHDMDYYLLRYGPEDVGKITDDDSTARKYYGALKMYEGKLPSVIAMQKKVFTEKYKTYWRLEEECVVKTYYQMSNNTFRAEVTIDGHITEVFSYKYRLELEGKNPVSNEQTKCMVLSNTKNVSFDDIIWKEIDRDTAEHVLVSVKLCE